MGDAKKRVRAGDQDICPPPTKRKTITSHAVANFFTPTSQKPAEETSFHIVENTLLVAKHGAIPPTPPAASPVRIAAFDLDDALITTRSGRRFARDAEDWKWWDASVPTTLRRLADEGFLLAVLSNQAAVQLKSPGPTRSRELFQRKVAAVLRDLALPLRLYAATGADTFRKPRVGMWDRLLADSGLSAADVDRAQSVFVGDAAGRQADAARGARADHACSDRSLAANADIRFRTPDEFFRGEPPRPFLQPFEPTQHLTSAPRAAPSFHKRAAQELVLLCGRPGAGKSTFYRRTLAPQGYSRVNQDTLRTRERCVQAAREQLRRGASVAVDNTNADAATRALWTAEARRAAVPVRLVLFTAGERVCEHNNVVRALGGVEVSWAAGAVESVAAARGRLLPCCSRTLTRDRRIPRVARWCRLLRFARSPRGTVSRRSTRALLISRAWISRSVGSVGVLRISVWLTVALVSRHRGRARALVPVLDLMVCVINRRRTKNSPKPPLWNFSGLYDVGGCPSLGMPGVGGLASASPRSLGARAFAGHLAAGLR